MHNKNDSLTTESQLLTTLKKKALENIVEKGENVGNQHFPLFPPYFPFLPDREIVNLATFNVSSANAFNLVTSRVWSSGNHKRVTYFVFDPWAAKHDWTTYCGGID